MKNIIVITGHAHYATGLLSSFEMIAGKNNDIIALDFVGNDISKEYEEIILKNTYDNILFICDLVGGTPFKEAQKISYDRDNIEVVVGCNLGSLLEISMIKDSLNLNDLVSKIISSSQKNIIHFDKNKILDRKEQNDEGI
jgi:PTS system N-acetylgalactosamine-specific IIA component